MAYEIDGFWTAQLDSLERPSKTTLQGWETPAASYQGFVEADLELRLGFDDLTAPIWFVSAPGAVGKSTLAREIAARTGAIYLDLSRAETVAGNYLTGGLVNNGLLDNWTNNRCTVLIDALDEARLRVTQDSFEHFLHDVQNRSAGRSVPTIFFGRVGIVDEAWLILSEQGIDCPIFEIQLFDQTKAVDFVTKTLDRLANTPRYADLSTALNNHRPVYRDAASKLVKNVEDATRHDASRFAGYAPVLEAAGTRLAAETNPARLNHTVEEQLQKDVLRNLSEQIMNREASKLRAQLPDDIAEDVQERLYDSDEQISRLVRIVYGELSPPHYYPPAGYEREYDDTVKQFINEHPFLDGTGTVAANSVFSAFLESAALFDNDSEIVKAARRSIEGRERPANPFFLDFYLADHRRSTGSDNTPIPAEHIGYLYDSAASRQESGQSVYLNIDADDDDSMADAEIQITSNGSSDPFNIELTVSHTGTVRFPTHVKGVFVDAPNLHLLFGDKESVQLVAPVVIDCSSITFECPELDIYPPDPSSKMPGQSLVSLSAGEVDDTSVTKPPRVRGDVSFSVSWPGSHQHPWVNFSTAESLNSAPDVDEHLRRLAKIVIAFRSHSKGNLARLKDKIDHERIAKGPGSSVRDRLIRDGVIWTSGRMYYLDPDKLGRVVGATFHDMSTKCFSNETIAYVRAIAAADGK